MFSALALSFSFPFSFFPFFLSFPLSLFLSFLSFPHTLFSSFPVARFPVLYPMQPGVTILPSSLKMRFVSLGFHLYPFSLCLTDWLPAYLSLYCSFSGLRCRWDSAFGSCGRKAQLLWQSLSAGWPLGQAGKSNGKWEEKRHRHTQKRTWRFTERRTRFGH